MKPPVHAVRELRQAIKRLRLPRKMTQQELADASGLDIRYIGSIERGQRNPTFGALQGIASVFGMKTSDLCGRRSSKVPALNYRVASLFERQLEAMTSCV
jgi:transcriptional regulator with XRE-family HTH domain